MVALIDLAMLFTGLNHDDAAAAFGALGRRERAA
jgi:hypothetical protein